MMHNLDIQRQVKTNGSPDHRIVLFDEYQDEVADMEHEKHCFEIVMFLFLQQEVNILNMQITNASKTKSSP